MNIRGSIIYNVKILGKSVGLTFNKDEAQRWANTMASKREVIPLKYDVPQYSEIMARLSSK